MIQHALLAHCRAPIHAIASKSWPDLATMLTAHLAGQKDGPAWMPARIEPGPRLAARVQAITALTLDIEAKAEVVDGAKRVTGPLPPELPELAQELRARRWRAALATTYSHREPTADGDLGPRYRLALDLSRELRPEELRPFALHVAALLGLAEATDSTCAEPARLLFLPRHPRDRAHLAQREIVDGEPLDVDALLAQVASTQGPARGAAQQAASDDASVIAAFNRQADIPALLDRHGYVDKGRGRWLWPGSTTGVPGVVYLPDKGRVYSAHERDPLAAGGKAHDAFSAWCVLEHGSDERAAVRDAAERLGMSQHDAPRVRFSSTTVEAALRPLPPELLPVPAFPVDALPDTLRPWVADVSDRMQCPPDFVAVPLLVAASAMAARHVVVRPRRLDDWSEHANLWALIVGRPSLMKSPAMRAALDSIERIEGRAAQAHNEAIAQHKAETVISKLRSESLMKEARQKIKKDRDADISGLIGAAEETEPPARRRFVVTAPTWEKLHELLADNPGGLLMTRDEMSGWLRTLGHEEAAEARSFFVQSWSGGRFTVDRIGRGTITAEDMRLSIIGAIQPGPLQQIVRASRRGTGDDGLLERFLVAWPDSPVEWRDIDRLPDGRAAMLVRDTFDRLEAASSWSIKAEQPETLDGEPDGMPMLRLDDAAAEMFSEWRADLERRLRKPDGEAHEAALAKFRHHVPALALTIHLASGATGPVTGAAMLRALALGEYFEAHSRRLYGSGQSAASTAARALLAKATSGALPDPFTAKDAYAPHWSGLDRETVIEAIDLLVSHGWLLETAITTGGRPTAVYSLTEGARRG